MSKMDLFVELGLHWKPLTFVAEGSILDRPAYNEDPKSSSKVWLYNYRIDSYFHKSPLNWTIWQLLAPSE